MSRYKTAYKGMCSDCINAEEKLTANQINEEKTKENIYRLSYKKFCLKYNKWCQNVAWNCKGPE